MELYELIEYLEKKSPHDILARGFGKPHSYRGYYEELAFEPVENVAVGQMLKDARGAVGATYTGWKGGEYKMEELSTVFLSEKGKASGDYFSPMLLDEVFFSDKNVTIVKGSFAIEDPKVGDLLIECYGNERCRVGSYSQIYRVEKVAPDTFTVTGEDGGKVCVSKYTARAHDGTHENYKYFPATESDFCELRKNRVWRDIRDTIDAMKDDDSINKEHLLSVLAGVFSVSNGGQ